MTTLVRLADGGEAGAIEGSLPDWSPDGSRIAFLRRASPVPPCETEFCPPVPCGLWLFDVASRQEERVTPDEVGCEYAGPHWSPDGGAIALANRVISVEGGEVFAADEGESLAAEPWSPDGSALAALVVDELTNERAIEVISVATGQRRIVVPEGDAIVVQAGWAPDGEFLVYTAVVVDEAGHGAPRIHVVPAAGGGPTPIGPEDAQFPLWQPLPAD